jgi:hypothetical protein
MIKRNNSPLARTKREREREREIRTFTDATPPLAATDDDDDDIFLVVVVVVVVVLKRESLPNDEILKRESLSGPYYCRVSVEKEAKKRDREKKGVTRRGSRKDFRFFFILSSFWEDLVVVVVFLRHSSASSLFFCKPFHEM